MRKELEERLIKLCIMIHELCKLTDYSFFAQHLVKQIVRSSTSAALNYGEAQAAESKRDFAHKVSIVLKELKETKINLRLMSSIVQANKKNDVDAPLRECDHLIAIFHKTVISTKKGI
jgi:four helix bundle protein